MAVLPIATLKANMPTGIAGGTSVQDIHDLIDTMESRTTQAVLRKTSSYTASPNDNRLVITFNSVSGVTLTLPNTLPEGWECKVVQMGLGQVTISAGEIAPLSLGQNTKTAGQYAVASVLIESNTSGTAAVAILSGSIAGTVETTPRLMGVNLSAAEIGTAIPGVYGADYYFPTPTNLDYYKSKGLTLIRLPFLWERMQPTLNGALNTAYLNHTKDVCTAAAARGMKVMLDAHNYGRYNGNLLGSAQVPNSAFRDFWVRMATEFVGNAGVHSYDIMNEPHDMGASTVWPLAAQAAVDGIRTVDTTTTIVVSGDGWAGASQWMTYNASLSINDPSNKIIYQAHCYFDPNSSGVYAETYDQAGGTPTLGVQRVQPFLTWLTNNNRKGFVGEYGVPDDDPRWLTMLDNFLAALVQANVPGTYFTGGPWWDDSTPIAIEPVNGVDRPQMATVAKYPSV